jgi:hypothetical protein
MSKRLRFEWHYPEGFSHKPVSGIYGGLLPSGDLLLEFFLERMAPPDYEIREISEANPAGKPVEFAEQKVVRTVQCGMVANLQSVAPSMNGWAIPFARSMPRKAGHPGETKKEGREATSRRIPQ